MEIRMSTARVHSQSTFLPPVYHYVLVYGVYVTGGGRRFMEICTLWVFVFLSYYSTVVRGSWYVPRWFLDTYNFPARKSENSTLVYFSMQRVTGQPHQNLNLFQRKYSRKFLKHVTQPYIYHGRFPTGPKSLPWQIFIKSTMVYYCLISEPHLTQLSQPWQIFIKSTMVYYCLTSEPHLT